MGRYVVEERLGVGGMAEVFRARLEGAEGFSRPVAFKRMSPALSEDPEFAELFIAEARLAARLSHPNIVSILDFDRDESGALFLVMELVDGADLRRLLAAAGRARALLPYPVTAFVIGEVLRALAYAHDFQDNGRPLGIVHRDVSPHNVLVSRAGAVKLSDFGIAKATAISSLSRAGSIKGKVAYMSPEQALGTVPLDGRSDLFSVGVMLHEMLAGVRPFEGATEAETLSRLLAGAWGRVSDQNPSAPPELCAVCDRLLVADREGRYRDAREALAAVTSLGCYPADGQELLAREVARWLPPPQVREGASVARAVAPVGEPTASRRRPSRRTMLLLFVGALVSTTAAAILWWPKKAARRKGAPIGAEVPAARAPGASLPPPAADGPVVSPGASLPPPAADGPAVSPGASLPPPAADGPAVSPGASLPQPAADGSVVSPRVSIVREAPVDAGGSAGFGPRGREPDSRPVKTARKTREDAASQKARREFEVEIGEPPPDLVPIEPR